MQLPLEPLRLGDVITACFWRSLEEWRKQILPRMDQDEALAERFHNADISIQLRKDGAAMCFVQIGGVRPYESTAHGYRLRMVKPRWWVIDTED